MGLIQNPSDMITVWEFGFIALCGVFAPLCTEAHG